MKKIKIMMLMLVLMLNSVLAATTVQTCDFSIDLCDWIESDDSVAQITGVTASEYYSGLAESDYMMLYSNNESDDLEAIAEVTFNKAGENTTLESGFKITWRMVGLASGSTAKLEVYDNLTLVKTCKYRTYSSVFDNLYTCSFRDAEYNDLTVKLTVNDGDHTSSDGNVFVTDWKVEYGDLFANVDITAIYELLGAILPLIVVMGLMNKMLAGNMMKM